MNELSSEFSHIINDNKSGSTKVLQNLIHLLQKALHDGPEPGHLKEGVNRVCDHHAAMAILQSFRSTFMDVLDSKGAAGTLTWLKAYEHQWDDIHLRMARQLEGQLDFSGACVLLHSYSETVVKVLGHISQERSFSVIQTESRPAFEGRLQAVILMEKGIAVQLIIDAETGRFLKGIDGIILGADQYSDSHFLNKTGSLGIALLAEHYNKPVLVVADERKKVRHIEHNHLAPDREVWPNAPAQIRVENRYFEEVPLSLATLITG